MEKTQLVLMPLVRLLVQERHQRNWSQEQLADKIGYSYSHMAKLECGQRTPSINMLINLAETFGYELTLRKMK